MKRNEGGWSWRRKTLRKRKRGIYFRSFAQDFEYRLVAEGQLVFAMKFIQWPLYPFAEIPNALLAFPHLHLVDYVARSVQLRAGDNPTVSFHWVCVYFLGVCSIWNCFWRWCGCIEKYASPNWTMHFKRICGDCAIRSARIVLPPNKAVTNTFLFCVHFISFFTSIAFIPQGSIWEANNKRRACCGTLYTHSFAFHSDAIQTTRTISFFSNSWKCFVFRRGSCASISATLWCLPPDGNSSLLWLSGRTDSALFACGYLEHHHHKV